jgi:endonuclease/exonuclease/phosphatase family metal-dependent hydrolase
VLLRVEVRTPRGPLDVYSTHVSRDDCQVRKVSEVVQARAGPLPAILTGDFNATESSDAIRALTAAGFVDAFRAANADASGATVWQRMDAPVSTVTRRVDFVFVGPASAARARVRQSRVVLDTPGRRADGAPLWASDHYGVLAVVEIGSTTAR